MLFFILLNLNSKSRHDVTISLKPLLYESTVKFFILSYFLVVLFFHSLHFPYFFSFLILFFFLYFVSFSFTWKLVKFYLVDWKFLFFISNFLSLVFFPTHIYSSVVVSINFTVTFSNKFLSFFLYGWSGVKKAILFDYQMSRVKKYIFCVYLSKFT